MDKKLTRQQAQVLEWLEVMPITTVDAVKTLFCLRLSERIRELRAKGYNIESKKAKGKSYQQYTLIKVEVPKYQSTLV